MRSTSLASLFLVAGMPLACGVDDGMPMSHQMGELREHVAALEQEAGVHMQDAHAAAAMDAVMAIEAQHYPRTMGHMNDMDDKMDDIGMCRDRDSRTPAMGEMAGDLRALRQECDEHASRLMGLSDLMAARAEEIRHADAAWGMLGRLRDHMRTLEPHAGAFMCHRDSPAHGSMMGR